MSQSQKMTWMIVEDDTAIRDIICTMCEIWGFNTLVFVDGYQAASYINTPANHETMPDIALIDIRMPGPWGHELSAMIRSNSYFETMPVILMTAYELAGEDEQNYLHHSQADRIIYKPLPPMDALLTMAQEVIVSRSKRTTTVNSSN